MMTSDTQSQTSKRAMLPKVFVTERDAEVLLDIYKYRYLSVSQIQRLHFPSLQTTYRRLRALVSLGFIKGFLAPHTPEHIYYLDAKGAEAVAGHLGVGISDLSWTHASRHPKDYYFLRHFLAASDFRIALTQGCLQSSLTLRGFIPEYFGERKSGGQVTKYIRDVVCDIQDPAGKLSHTPDAVFALEKNSNVALFFLEIDRGTEVVGNTEKGVLKCVRFYLNYLVSGGYRRYETDFNCDTLRGFRALIITTSAARIRNIKEAASRLDVAGNAKQFIWLTESKAIDASGVLAPIWCSADARDENTYRIG